MRRVIARFALFTFCSSSIAAYSRAEVCVSPRIKLAKACGIVIDPYGMRIPNAKVDLVEGESRVSATTDKNGKFSFTTQGEEVHLSVGASGFQSVETSIGKIKSAAEPCKKPLFVMLTLGGQGCAMISLRKSDLLLAKKE